MDTIDTTRCESCNYCYQSRDWSGRCYLACSEYYDKPIYTIEQCPLEPKKEE